MLFGQRIFLRTIERKDTFIMKNWRNDPSVKENIFSYNFVNDLQQERWFEKYNDNLTEEIFMIVLKDREEEIGVIGLSSIDLKNQNAVLNTMIGEKKYWNQGYASEALNILLTYAFNEMNLNRITSYLYEFNKASIRKNEKNGFAIEGLLKQMYYTGGKYHNIIIMGLLREDWRRTLDLNKPGR